jgi:hypothetical protein
MISSTTQKYIIGKLNEQSLPLTNKIINLSFIFFLKMRRKFWFKFKCDGRKIRFIHTHIIKFKLAFIACS